MEIMKSQSKSQSPAAKQKQEKRSKAQEKDALKNNDLEPQSWRQSDTSAGPRSLSRGIAPSHFYSSNAELKENLPPRNSHSINSGRRRPRTDPKLQNILDGAAQNCVREQRREVATKHKLRRAAYKEVTSLKTWPLQDMAMKDLDRLLATHHGEQEAIIEEEAEKEHGDSTGLSSSSLDEPKRSRSFHQSSRTEDDDAILSPRKNTLRHNYKMEFLQEQKYQVEVSLENRNCDANSEQHLFLDALWCMEPRMFAIEKSATGKRKYLVGSLGRFLDLYWRKCDPKNRHYYELIRENTPCRMYFDLEFPKQANPEIGEVASEALLYEFVEELIIEIRNVYGIVIHRDCVVDLDSSTEKKFSRHLIVHMPNKALFADAAAVGRFVRLFVGRLAEETTTGVLEKTRSTLAKHLFVNSKVLSNQSSIPEVDNKTCFVDMGVYTRNRLFRLMGSSKFGKPASAALRLASTNQFPFSDSFGNDKFYMPDIENKSSNASPRADTEMDNQLEEDIKKFKSAMDWTIHAEALAKTLVVPANYTKLNFPILPNLQEPEDSSMETKLRLSKNLRPLSGTSSANRPNDTVYSTGNEKSPFPILDDYALQVLGSRGEVQGAIRVWSIDHEYTASQDKGTGAPRSITYQFCRNRWCERIGRPHKSNNIMWTVNFLDMKCVQTCHDPECKLMRFRGRPVDLPTPVRESVADVLFEQHLAMIDEETLLGGNKKSEIAFQDELDSDFEKALLALDLNDKGTTDKTTRKENELGLEQPPSQQKENKTHFKTDNLAENSCSTEVEYPNQDSDFLEKPPGPGECRVKDDDDKTSAVHRSKQTSSQSDSSDDEDLVAYSKRLEAKKQQKNLPTETSKDKNNTFTTSPEQLAIKKSSTEYKTMKERPDKKNDDNSFDGDLLSDTVLYDAALDNPDLFP